MPDEAQQRVHDLLDAMRRAQSTAAARLDAARELFSRELNYPYTDDPLSTRHWNESARHALAEGGTPKILARCGEPPGGFPIIHLPLADASKQASKQASKSLPSG